MVEKINPVKVYFDNIRAEPLVSHVDDVKIMLYMNTE